MRAGRVHASGRAADMELTLAHLAAALLGGAFLYLVYVCHAMHCRQKRLEEYVTAAIRVGTVMAGGAAVGPALQLFRAATGGGGAGRANPARE